MLNGVFQDVLGVAHLTFGPQSPSDVHGQHQRLRMLGTKRVLIRTQGRDHALELARRRMALHGRCHRHSHLLYCIT
jgi:hypothetical protein